MTSRASPCNVEIRAFAESDAPACCALLFDVVREGTVRFYDERQRAAWAPAPMSPAQLCARLGGQHVWVAVDSGGVAGFFSLRLPNTLDFAYVRRDCMGTGVALQLYETLLDEARRLGITVLTSESSELARRFFERRGWRVVARQDFVHNDTPIYNYAMELQL